MEPGSTTHLGAAGKGARHGPRHGPRQGRRQRPPQRPARLDGAVWRESTTRRAGAFLCAEMRSTNTERWSPRTIAAAALVAPDNRGRPRARAREGLLGGLWVGAPRSSPRPTCPPSTSTSARRIMLPSPGTGHLVMVGADRGVISNQDIDLKWGAWARGFGLGASSPRGGPTASRTSPSPTATRQRCRGGLPRRRPAGGLPHGPPRRGGLRLPLPGQRGVRGRGRPVPGRGGLTGAGY